MDSPAQVGRRSATLIKIVPETCGVSSGKVSRTVDGPPLGYGQYTAHFKFCTREVVSLVGLNG